MLPYIMEIFVFVFGLCIGSFLNVCIYRLPVSKSIAHPGSMCPSCATPIKFYDNMPIISYLLLQGKKRLQPSQIGLGCIQFRTSREAHISPLILAVSSSPIASYQVSRYLKQGGQWKTNDNCSNGNTVVIFSNI